MYKINIIPRTLHFKQAAGTSRGVYHTRKVWYILLKDCSTGAYGIGECAPLPDLSCDDIPFYEDVLRIHCTHTEEIGSICYEDLLPYPSMLLGLETAFAHLQAKSLNLWPSAFTEGKKGIQINGLIWMGDFNKMYQRIEEKLKAGFRCIKLKIGGIDFERELQLLAHIRRHFPPETIELRVDANGAFSPEEAPNKLERLSEYQLHSIEQPIRAGQWECLAKLCAASPLPIALDEELIGINKTEQKENLLDIIRPQYLVLKPSLHGGFKGTEEWIELCKKRNIGWWITSALESNVGLNAIAQWCATQHPNLPQGLGTGMLYTDNIPYPLYIHKDELWFSPNESTPNFDMIL